MSRQQGFTLIELLVAITIMALVCLMAWRGLDSIGRSSTALQLRTEDNARLLRVLQQIERDIDWRASTELASPATDWAPQGGVDQVGDGPHTAPIALLPVGMQTRSKAGSAFFIELVRAAPAAPGHWQCVQWWLQQNTLYRAAGAAASRYPLPAPQSADRVAVLEGVQRLEVLAWEPGRGWQNLPAHSPAKVQASALVLTVVLPHGAGAPWRYRKVIALR
ncbi:MAG: prepilin-type N-terminal cleavage/methylation domain-containing protein [Comamonas sp.]|jgi:general secretion pathway protein J|nr:prepilin-type N-terminal cleavage/methylation domain-containing protein [Comamonas sp.]